MHTWGPIAHIYVPTSRGVCKIYVHGVNVHPCVSLISASSRVLAFPLIMPASRPLAFLFCASPPSSHPFSRDLQTWPMDEVLKNELSDFKPSVKWQQGVMSQNLNPHRDKNRHCQIWSSFLFPGSYWPHHLSHQPLPPRASLRASFQLLYK